MSSTVLPQSSARGNAARPLGGYPRPAVDSCVIRSVLSALLIVGVVTSIGCGGPAPTLVPPPPPDAGPDGVLLPDLLLPDAITDLPITPDGLPPPDGGPTDAISGDGPPDVVVPVACDASVAECSARGEQAATDKLASLVQGGDDQALLDYLTQVPKGGDLHHHLSGAIYAETYLEWARSEGGYCITSSSLSLSSSCGSGTVAIPAATDPLYTRIVEAWSMQDFTASSSQTGHDHFFATFGKFGAISGSAHHGMMLADVMSRAASENQVYIELMLTSNSTAGSYGDSTWSTNHGSAQLTAADLQTFYGQLTASSTGLDGAVQPILTDVTNSEQKARQVLGCDGASPQPGCSVSTRYIIFISRSGSTPGVFAQMVAAYEAAIRDPRVVAVNLVGPEDGTGALSRYDVEMSMLDFLYQTYREPSVSPLRVTLHAGELAPAFTPSSYPIGTINHIRKAVEIGHAERIGHGVDVLMETDSAGLLAELASMKVLVEVCLSSNTQILEVSGTNHPLGHYLDSGVPVALATDDQGVSRSSLAREYVRAATDQALDYRKLKALARASLEWSFLPGSSLWSAIDTAQPVTACVPGEASYLGDPAPGADCAALLAGSGRAKVQWELERRFHDFEARQ
jgi:hypothetical protein